MSSNANANKIPALRYLDAGIPDPVDDWLFWYRLNGTDSELTRVGANDYRTGPECNDKKSSYFDGTSQYYTSDGDSADVSVGTGAFSISAWVNTTGIAVTDVLSNGSGDAATNSFRYRMTSTGVMQFRSNATNRSGTIAINDGDWHHVVVTIAGSSGTISFYVDGAFDNNATPFAYDLQDSTLLKVGARGDTAANKWNGGLDGIRFYDRVLSLSEV